MFVLNSGTNLSTLKTHNNAWKHDFILGQNYLRQITFKPGFVSEHNFSYSMWQERTKLLSFTDKFQASARSWKPWNQSLTQLVENLCKCKKISATWTANLWVCDASGKERKWSIFLLQESPVHFPTWCQFHQHSMSSFCTCRSQKRKKTLMTYLYCLCFCDLRVQKLCQFHQHSIFIVHRSQKYKKDTDDLTVFFTLLGSAHAKAAQKMLMKLTP